MNVVVSVDALVPPLTGIGRYTWELVSRLPREAGVERLRFFRAGRWVVDPARFLNEPGYRRRRQLLPMLLGGVLRPFLAAFAAAICLAATVIL